MKQERLFGPLALVIALFGPLTAGAVSKPVFQDARKLLEEMAKSRNEIQSFVIEQGQRHFG